jgi:hypothetical protein
MGRGFVIFGAGRRDFEPFKRAAWCGISRSRKTMNSYVKAYLTFLAFQAVTRIVVKPIATSLNVPLITTIVG